MTKFSQRSTVSLVCPCNMSNQVAGTAGERVWESGTWYTYKIPMMFKESVLNGSKPCLFWAQFMMRSAICIASVVHSTPNYKRTSFAIVSIWLYTVYIRCFPSLFAFVIASPGFQFWYSMHVVIFCSKLPSVHSTQQTCRPELYHVACRERTKMWDKKKDVLWRVSQTNSPSAPPPCHVPKATANDTALKNNYNSPCAVESCQLWDLDFRWWKYLKSQMKELHRPSSGMPVKRVTTVFMAMWVKWPWVNW